MLTHSNQKKMVAAILRGQESAGSLKTIISSDQAVATHINTILHSFSTCLSLLQSSSHRANKKRKIYGEGEELIRDSPTPIVDDCFSWRKYGQKIIKNSPHQRNYYRCSGCNCKAKKYVQKIQDSPPIFRNTYVGQHMCQADLFLQSTNESSMMLQFDQASTHFIDHQRPTPVPVPIPVPVPVPVPVTNQECCDDYDLLNDVWVSDQFETMVAHNNFDLDRFQI